MKIIYPLTFLALLFSNNAFALSGEFNGPGNALYNGRVIQCDFIEMRLADPSETQFILRGGGYKCGAIQAEYPYSVFEREGNNLIYEGQEVGVVSENSLRLALGEFSLELKLNESSKLHYKETWDDGQDQLIIEGELNP